MARHSMVITVSLDGSDPESFVLDGCDMTALREWFDNYCAREIRAIIGLKTDAEMADRLFNMLNNRKEADNV